MCVKFGGRCRPTLKDLNHKDGGGELEYSLKEDCENEMSENVQSIIGELFDVINNLQAKKPTDTGEGFKKWFFRLSCED